MNYLLEAYLTFLQEREWDDPDDPGSVHPDFLDKVLGKLTGSGDLAQFRQAHQPSMVNVYIKRSLGDYRGRANTLNTYRFKKAGIEDWEDAKKILKKAIDHEKKICPERFLKGIKTVQNISKEPLGRELGPDGISSDGYTDGVSLGPAAMSGGGGGD
jgi:hypothetical protein